MVFPVNQGVLEFPASQEEREFPASQEEMAEREILAVLVFLVVLAMGFDKRLSISCCKDRMLERKFCPKLGPSFY